MEIVHDKANEIVVIDGVQFSEHYVQTSLTPHVGDIGATFRIAKIGGVLTKVRVIPRDLFQHYKISIGMKYFFLILTLLAAFLLKSAPIAILCFGTALLYGAVSLIIRTIGAACDYIISEVKSLPKDPNT
jgi:hypothetical protein